MDPDFEVLVELFDLKVLATEGATGDLMQFGGIPELVVEGENGVVYIRKLGGKFQTTGLIAGVPLRFFGCGSWTYMIEL